MSLKVCRSRLERDYPHRNGKADVRDDASEYDSTAGKKSLAKAYQRALSNPCLSFSQSMGNSFRQTVASIFARQDMEPNQMLSGHRQSTLARVDASESDYIIAAQDTPLLQLFRTSGDDRVGDDSRKGARLIAT